MKKVVELVRDFYVKTIGLLSCHKGVPFVLAHGGIHLFLLVVLCITSIWMFFQLREINIASFNQISYTFYGDTLNNYKLDYMVFEKDMRRRSGYQCNFKDIQLTYGYVKDTTKTDMRIVNPIKIDDDRYNCDLVSVVRYVTKNSLKDTLINKKQQFKTNSLNQWLRTIMISNHERLYYCYSTLKDKTHIFYRVTHAKDRLIEWEKNTPLFNYWMGIVMKKDVKLNNKSYIKIYINDINPNNAVYGIEQPIIIEKIVPKPTVQNMNEIVYKGRELEQVISQQGIYVSGVDPIKKEKAERKNLYFTVALGTMITFMLDIIVQLVLKWRKLKTQYEKS